MAVRLKNSESFDIYNSKYRQVQSIDSKDTRNLEERLSTLPVIRDEDLGEWREWAERNVFDNR